MSQESAVTCNPPTEPAVVSAESLGAWLARTRVSQGADLRVAARRLGLNPILIQALEADDFTPLGPPVFVRGYLSRYARFLDLPEQAVLDRYRQQASASQEPPPLKVVHPRRRQTRVRDLSGFFYLLIVIGVGWTTVQHLGDLDPSQLTAWWSGEQQENGAQNASKPMAVTTQTHYPFQPKPDEAVHEPAPPAPAAREPGTAPAPGPEPNSSSAIALATLSSASHSAAALKQSAMLPGVTTATVSATVAANSGSSTSDSRSEARLMLQFSDDCWVEVKDAQGKMLANGLMKANTTHAISGPAPFVVTLGNAPAARIALDDRLVDSSIYLPRRGTVSRFTLTPTP